MKKSTLLNNSLLINASLSRIGVSSTLSKPSDSTVCSDYVLSCKRDKVKLYLSNLGLSGKYDTIIDTMMTHDLIDFLEKKLKSEIQINIFFNQFK